MRPKEEPATEASLAEEAASWLLTLQYEELSAAQRAEFVDWLRQSPHHISEMLRVCQLQRDLARFKGWSKHPAPLKQDVPISTVIQLVTKRPAARRRRRGHGHPYRAALVVAGVA